MCKPDVFPSVTTTLTANGAGCGSKVFKVLIAWASPFLPSPLFSSCLQYNMISFEILVLLPSAPAIQECFLQGECSRCEVQHIWGTSRLRDRDKQ